LTGPNKAAHFILVSKALTRTLTTKVVAVIVMCPGLNPDWFTFKIHFSDKEQSCKFTKDPRILASQGRLEMGQERNPDQTQEKNQSRTAGLL
jgi:hypothetical protein